MTRTQKVGKSGYYGVSKSRRYWIAHLGIYLDGKVRTSRTNGTYKTKVIAAAAADELTRIVYGNTTHRYNNVLIVGFDQVKALVEKYGYIYVEDLLHLVRGNKRINSQKFLDSLPKR